MLLTPSSSPRPATRQRAGRAAILQSIRAAAITEFSQQGFKGATTQSIAERAGLSKPQLHYYIASKEELYQDLLQDIVEHWMAAFAFDGADTDVRTVLTRYVHKKLDFALDQPELSRIFTREILDGGPNLGHYWPGALRHIQMKIDRIEQWIAQGAIYPTDARLLLMHIWAMTQHYADYETQVRVVLGQPDHEPLDRTPIAEALTALVLRGVGLEPLPPCPRPLSPSTAPVAEAAA